MRVGRAGALAALATLAVCVAGCKGKFPYDHLSDYGYFEGEMRDLVPVQGVIPYDTTAFLFADFAWKHRFILLPAGARVTYDANDTWEFPVGTVIIKTFTYPVDARDPSLGERLIETRLLVHRIDGWTPEVYLWNDEQTDADLLVAGTRVDVAWIDSAGAGQTHAYIVPNTNQCFSCHLTPPDTDVIGLKTRLLNRDYDYGSGAENQIDHFEALGWFDAALPPAADRGALPDPYGTVGTVEERARAYLEINCAHCHGATGAATSTGLWLSIFTADPVDYGVCRAPFSAGSGTGGFMYDIVPGDPDMSIMIFRMETTDPEIHMPELPVQLIDPAGVQVVRDWIAAMTPAGCP